MTVFFMHQPTACFFLTARDIQYMSEDELLDMDYFLNDDELDDDYGEEGFYIF